MSLLTDSMELCKMKDKRTVPDGVGGFNTEWVDGAEFKAAIVFNNSMEARVAERANVTALYTVTTPMKINLQYHDVFTRMSDGKIFRVTSDGDDLHIPLGAIRTSALDMRQVSAEEWEIPKNGK